MSRKIGLAVTPRMGGRQKSERRKKAPSAMAMEAWGTDGVGQLADRRDGEERTGLNCLPDEWVGLRWLEVKGGEQYRMTLKVCGSRSVMVVSDRGSLVRTEATCRGSLMLISLTLVVIVSGETKCMYPAGIWQ